jgi:Glycosyltransferase
MLVELPLIVHVITGLETGGAELMLSRLVRGSKDFRHVVISLTGKGTIGPDLVSNGIEVIALGLRPGLAALTGLPRLMLLIRRLRPALVQTWLYHADMLGTLAAFPGGCRNVVWALRCSNMDRERYGRLLALLARLSPLPRAVLANSQTGKDWHERLGYRPRAWHVIVNGIDTTRFRPDAEARARWRKQLGIGGHMVLVGMVARVDPMKNHAAFLAAARQISQIRPDVAFVVAGRGTEDLPEGQVIRLGEVKDVAGLYAAMDISLLISRFGEGFPNVVAEAMACGLPVIVSDIGDSARIIADTGITVPVDDENALESAIRFLTDDPQHRLSLGKKARRRVEHEYSLTKAVAAFEDVWRSIMVEKG